VDQITITTDNQTIQATKATMTKRNL